MNTSPPTPAPHSVCVSRVGEAGAQFLVLLAKWFPVSLPLQVIVTFAFVNTDVQVLAENRIIL